MWILVEVDEPHDVGKDELQRILIYDMTIDVEPLFSDLHVVAEGHAVHPATPSVPCVTGRKVDVDDAKKSARGAPEQEPPILRGMPAGD